MRADVSDALLRLLDEPGGEEIVITDWLVTDGWDAAGATICFFGGDIVCVGDGEAAREGHRAKHYREADDSAWRGNLRDGSLVSRAGIRHGLSVVTVDG